MIYKVATVIYNGSVKMLDQKNGGKKKENDFVRPWTF